MSASSSRTPGLTGSASTLIATAMPTIPAPAWLYTPRQMHPQFHLIPHPLIQLGPGPSAGEPVVGTDQLCQKFVQ